MAQALSAPGTREPGAFPPAMLEAYERAIDLLPRFQVEGARVVDVSGRGGLARRVEGLTLSRIGMAN